MTCSPYKYQPLDSAKQQIRLLKLQRVSPEDSSPQAICCELHLVEFDAAPEYVALSYVWGPPSPTQLIHVDSKDFSVRQNLFDFLEIFQGHDGNACYLWIDQICIDQSSIPERNSQVRLMSAIYKRCKYVLSWLGLSATSEAKVFLEEPNLDNAANLMQNTYFTRIWIVQEVFLPDDVRFLAGTIWIQWAHLAQAVSKARQFHNDPSFVARWLFLDKTKEPISLAKALDRFAAMDCQDARDRIYGLLGLVAEDQRPEVDYNKSIHEAYIDAVNTLARNNFVDDMSYDFYGRAVAAFIKLAHGLWGHDPELVERERLLEVMFLSMEKASEMGFEPADLVAQTPDRWWYEEGGQRQYFDSEPEPKIIASDTASTIRRGAFPRPRTTVQIGDQTYEH